MNLFLHQLRGEQRLYWRSRELAFFTFLFPIVLFILLGSVYGNDRIKSEHNVKSSSYLLAGVLGYGVASTAFAGLAIVLVLRRESGILKRLRATPLPPAVYLAGVIASTVLVFAVEAAALIVLARVMFDVPFPEHWASVILSLLLGALSFAALGIALSGVIRSGEGSSAVVNAIYLPVLFLSGAFFPVHGLPEFLQWFADALPLTHLLDAMRAVFIHGGIGRDELQGLLVVVLWGVGGAVVALRTFRWEPFGG